MLEQINGPQDIKAMSRKELEVLAAEIRQFLKEGLVDFSIDQNLPYQSYQALSVLFGAVLEHRRPERDFFYPSSTILNAETVE